jgi:hypothetical protein
LKIKIDVYSQFIRRKRVSNKLFISTILAILTLVVGVDFLVIKPVTAVELTGGQKAFESSLHLIRTTTNFREHHISATRYKFTIEVPQDAGEALKSVKITQKKSFDTVMFNADKTEVSLGSKIVNDKISLAAMTGESQPGETIIVFDTPIEPGNTVTISVKPKQNPSKGGVYLFGVTAYPTGENSPGLYLGSGRIHINQ